MNTGSYWTEWRWRDWSPELYPFDWKSDPVQLELKVRSSIFIITGVCAGLPALVWSVSDIIHHRKNGHRISIFIILLLLTDFIDIFLSPYILIKLLLDEIPRYMDWTCWVFGSLWWAMKDCGLLLNQLVALEGILSVKYTASVIASRCFRIIQILLFLGFICNFFFPFIINSSDFPRVALFMFIVSLIPLIITCRTLCCANCHSHTSRKPDRHILVILVLTVPMMYLPYAFIFVDYFQSLSVFNIIFLLLSLRLISDPLLCVLVCRQNLTVQTSQKPENQTSLV